MDQLLASAKIVESAAPAEASVKLAREGEVDILLKGHLRTDEWLGAVLKKEIGLREACRENFTSRTLKRFSCLQRYTCSGTVMKEKDPEMRQAL